MLNKANIKSDSFKFFDLDISPFQVKFDWLIYCV